MKNANVLTVKNRLLAIDFQVQSIKKMKNEK